MPQLTVEGVEVYYRDRGAGPIVVLGHSSTGTGGQWRALIERLEDRFRLLAPDHLGYGRTGPYPGRLPVMRHEAAIIESLVARAEAAVHLVGHSYGGAVLLRHALARPQGVASLTLIEPTLFHLLAPAGRAAAHEEIRAVCDRVVRLVDAGLPHDAASGFIAYWSGPGAFEAMDERLRETVTGAMRKLRAEWPAAFEPAGATPEALAALDFPIQLIHGAATTAAARAVTEILRDVWPRARSAEIPAAGHMAPLTHPELVNPIVERFLENAG